MTSNDSDNQGAMVDFAVQLQVMVIILLFAVLWWFETRGNELEKILDRIESNQAMQPKDTASEVEKIVTPFLKDKASWKTAEPEIMKFR